MAEEPAKNPLSQLVAQEEERRREILKAMQAAIRTPHFAMPDLSAIGPAEDHASDFALRLFTKIREFEATLEAEQETGLHLANYNQALTLHVREVSWIDPALIVFGGVLDGSNHRATLVQHVSQINLILVALPRENPQAPRNPIGFHTARRPEEATS